MDFGRLIEEQLRKAREEGKFGNLRGHGQPLELNENPFEDPTWRLANDMLKRNGFRPEWLEEAVGIREQLEEAQRALRRSHGWRLTELAALEGRQEAKAIERRHWVHGEWALAQERFRARIAEINKAIFNYNLKAPSTRFQRVKIDAEEELAKVVGE